MADPRVKWRFVLVNSKDLSRIGVLQMARDRKVSLKLNKPGSGNFSYPMDANYAENIEKYRTGIIAERFNWRQTQANNIAGIYGAVWDPIWSGYVLTIDEDWTNNRMSIGCVGWMQRLAKRLLRAAQSWSAVDDGDIIRDIIQMVNGGPGAPSYEWAAGTTQYTAADTYVVKWPTGSSPNTSSWIKWGGTQPNEGTGVIGGTAYVPLTSIVSPRNGQSAARNFKVTKYQDALSPIDQVVNIEYGCDIVCDPITRAVTAHRRYSRVKDDVVIGFQWGPKNTAQFGRTLDGERQCNYFLAQGDPTATAGYADDPTGIADVGLIEEVTQLSGVAGAGPSGSANPVLLAYAGGEVVIRMNGVITYSVTPFVFSPNGPVPEPTVDYRVGDQIRVTAIHPPRGNIVNQAVRVFGMDFGIDDNDNEQLGALELSP
jgi:hypothetical protein